MALLNVFLTIGVLRAAWGADDYADKNIKIEDAPYIAELFTDQYVPCAGAIVNENFILTSQTCCEKNEDRPREKWIVSVGTNGNEGSIDNIEIKKTFYSPGLKPTYCLIQLARPLKLSEKVQIIGLDAGQAELSENKLVTLTAFKTDYQLRSTVLHQKTLPINGTDWCKKDAKRLDGAIFCAGDRKITACLGDAGGILTANGTVIGVISTASPDCHSAARFSRITYYRKEILTIIADNIYNIQIN